MGQFWASTLSSWSLAGLSFVSRACRLLAPRLPMSAAVRRFVCACLRARVCVCLWLSGLLRGERGERSEPWERSGSEARKTQEKRHPRATCVLAVLYSRLPGSVRLFASVFLCLWVLWVSQRFREILSHHLRLVVSLRLSPWAPRGSPTSVEGSSTRLKARANSNALPVPYQRRF